MTYLSYLIAKCKFDQIQSFSRIVNNKALQYTAWLSYFIAVGVAKKVYKNYNDIIITEKDKKCNGPLTHRIFIMFGLVVTPCFILCIFGAFCSMRSYRARIVKPSKNYSFQMNTLKILQRAETFMISTKIWFMVGMTIWSLRNIITIIFFFENECLKDRSKIDKFWIINFYLFTFLGYFTALITIIIFPGALLFQCYKQTERQNVQNPYHAAPTDEKIAIASSSSGMDKQDSSTKKRSSTIRRRVQMFDQHAQAEMQHMEKMSQTQQTFEDYK